ncbi:PhzF family phenazine biosynthesis protein [Dyella terrae]|uniref:PhzF family phenazine biosynthesis protein n=1 Tax=Dyella terrae TaxID=522259 RepID=UPI001EFEA249|nr:PhzF family phenazine biosynthesis protein [Dyella terrae]ULU24943.1 PhzF family phenazine biosynthesis protein [Dyella terrae]
MRTKRFSQIDVFSGEPFMGNPVAVVHGADDFSDEDMAALARWTNLSETCFLLEPTDPRADYRVRFFSSLREMPFAGHPTLGTCHAWLSAGGVPRDTQVMQECAIGLVPVRISDRALAFEAPSLVRSGAVDGALVERILIAFGLQRSEVRHAEWVDNGAGWLALMLNNDARLLALKPDLASLHALPIGLIAPSRGDAAYEVRAFVGGDAMPEDPATGSLNAGIARWLIETGMGPASFTIAQGTALGRKGRIHVQASDGRIWVGGACVTRVDGVLHA